MEQEETLPTDKNGNSDDGLAKDGYRNGNDSQDDVFVVELEKGDSGIGVGLIDGLVRDKFSVWLIVIQPCLKPFFHVVITVKWFVEYTYI